MWLKAVGIDASWIGIITAVPAVTRFTILPFVTDLAERHQMLRGAMMVTAFLTALGFPIVGTQHRAAAVFLAYAVTACVWTPTVPLTDGYALKGVTRYGLDYGPLRLWGSAAFVVGALACGLLVDVIAAQNLIWVIVAMAGLSAVVSLGLRPLEIQRRSRRRMHGAAALLRDPGFLAIIVASALIQGSHAAYYTFASITWQASGLGGLTIAGLWVLGVLAEIVVFALSPRFTLPPAALVMIGAFCAVARWLITAQEPPVAVLALVQTSHGLTYGLTQVGTMGLLVRHVPGPCDGAGAGLSRGLLRHRRLQRLDPVGRDLCPLRAGGLLRHGGDGAVGRECVMWLARHRAKKTRRSLSPRVRLPADRPCCRHSAARRRGRAPATAAHRDRRSGPAASAASPAPSTARSRPCSRP